MELTALPARINVRRQPPRELLLRKVLFTAGRFIVVPCQVDEGSVDGIARRVIVTLPGVVSESPP